MSLPLGIRLLAGFATHAPGREWASNPRLNDQNYTNCVVLGTNVIMYANPAKAWTPDVLKRCMLNAGTGPFENVDALVTLGVAASYNMRTTLAGGWYVVQKWWNLDPLEHGHFIIIYVTRNGSMYIMESSQSRPASQWFRRVPYEDPHEYFGVPADHVRVARLLP